MTATTRMQSSQADTYEAFCEQCASMNVEVHGDDTVKCIDCGATTKTETTVKQELQALIDRYDACPTSERESAWLGALRARTIKNRVRQEARELFFANLDGHGYKRHPHPYLTECRLQIRRMPGLVTLKCDVCGFLAEIMIGYTDAETERFVREAAADHDRSTQ